MIVVKIELWPRSNRYQAREIGRMYIRNTIRGATTTDPGRGDYEVKVCRNLDSGDRTQGSRFKYLGWGDIETTRTSEILNHSRSSDIWRLIIRALQGAFPEEH